MKTYCVALTFILLLGGGLARAAGAAEAPQGQILATYDVALAGFSLGELQLRARFQGPSYQMQGEGRFSLFLGKVYDSSGEASSAGQLKNAGPESATFTVSYEGGDKKEKRRISFNGGDVTDVTIVPPKKPGRRRVPVTE